MTTKTKLYKTSKYTVSLFFFVQGLVFATWASRIADIKMLLGLSELQLGSVLFAIPIGQMFTMSLAAWSINKYSSRRMLIIASFAYPLCLIPLALSLSVFSLTVSLLFYGVATSLYNIANNTQGVNVERVFEKNIMASLHGLWSMGAFVGGLLSFGFSYFNTSILLHFTVIALLSVFLCNYYRGGLLTRDASVLGSVAEDKKGGFFSKIDSYILWLGLMAFSAMVCEGAMFDWSGVYFTDVVCAPYSLTKLGYIVCMCSMTLGRFMADGAVRRWGNSKVVSASGLLILMGILLAVIIPTTLFATLGFLIVGFGISSTVPICYSMAGRSTTLSPSSALATVSTIGFLGFLFGPPVIGFMAHTLTLRTTFALISCVGVLVFLLSKKLR